MKPLVLTIFKLLIFPLSLIGDLWRIPRSLAKKLLLTLLVFIFFVLPWLFTILSLFSSAQVLLYEIGIIDKLSEVNVSGTSMEPTIHDGASVSLHNP